MTLPSRVEHSPLPWFVVAGGRDSEYAYIMGKKGRFICEIDISHPERKADVDFIVEACNAYEANQKALRVAVEAVNLISEHQIDSELDGRLAGIAKSALERIREIQEGK